MESMPSDSAPQEKLLTFAVTITVNPDHAEDIRRLALKHLDSLGGLAIDGQVQIYEDQTPIGPQYEKFQDYQQRQREVARVLEKAQLTDREEDIARLLAEGLSNPEIGAQLYISPLTVKSHLRRLFNKTGIRDRHELGAVFKDWVAAKAQALETRRLPRKF